MSKLQHLSRLRKRKITGKVFEINVDWTKRFREWYANGGQKALDAAMKRADKTIEEMRKAREPNWSRIHEPMTI